MTYLGKAFHLKEKQRHSDGPHARGSFLEHRTLCVYPSAVYVAWKITEAE